MPLPRNVVCRTKERKNEKAIAEKGLKYTICYKQKVKKLIKKQAKQYTKYDNKYLKGYTNKPKTSRYNTLAEAQKVCEKERLCNGITLEKVFGREVYSTRRGYMPMSDISTGYKQTSWVKKK